MHPSSPVMCKHLQWLEALELGLADPEETLSGSVRVYRGQRISLTSMMNFLPSPLTGLCPCGPSVARWPSAGETPGTGVKDGMVENREEAR